MSDIWDELMRIENLADTIQGEINRMCVTKDLSELDTMFIHAHANLLKLHKMIYDLKFREVQENE